MSRCSLQPSGRAPAVPSSCLTRRAQSQMCPRHAAPATSISKIDCTMRMMMLPTAATIAPTPAAASPATIEEIIGPFVFRSMPISKPAMACPKCRKGMTPRGTFPTSSPLANGDVSIAHHQPSILNFSPIASLSSALSPTFPNPTNRTQSVVTSVSHLALVHKASPPFSAKRASPSQSPIFDENLPVMIAFVIAATGVFTAMLISSLLPSSDRSQISGGVQVPRSPASIP